MHRISCYAKCSHQSYAQPKIIGGSLYAQKPKNESLFTSYLFEVPITLKIAEIRMEDHSVEEVEEILNYYLKIIILNMLRRSKAPPLPPTHPSSPHYVPSDAHAFKRDMVRSPPAVINRIERKKRQDTETRPSSLNSRLRRRNFQDRQEEEGVAPGNDPMRASNEYESTEDYFPSAQNKAPPRPNRFRPAEGTNERLMSDILPSFGSAPSFNAKARTSKGEKLLAQEEESTQSQISSDLQQPRSLPEVYNKEVKFGEVVEVNSRPNFRKQEQRGRSPSILKCNSRNLLATSVIGSEKSRERSMSATSNKSKRQKDKASHLQNTNRIIRQKYKAILSRLQAEGAYAHSTRTNRFSAATYGTVNRKVASPYKYKDQIFPPVYSSLFAVKRNRPKIGQQLSWKRVSELFEGHDLTLATSAPDDFSIVKSDSSYSEQYVVTAMNALRGSPKLLQRIFQSQSISPYGIYLVKIFQDNSWKYIIIDDYIPVLTNQEGKLEPAFISIKPNKEEKSVDIWPFLLEKAYANYYARYEALQYGNSLDFIEELTGTPSRMLPLTTNSPLRGHKPTAQDVQNAAKTLQKQMKLGDTVAIGVLTEDRGYIALVYDSKRQLLCFNDPYCGFKRRQIKFDRIRDFCRQVHLISPFKYPTTSSVVIRGNKGNMEDWIGRGHYLADRPYCLKVQVQQPAEYTVSVKQRDSRHFYFKEELQSYIWRRAILLQKEANDEEGYRWIDGLYSNKKSLNFTHFLEQGDYLLLVQTQWKPQCPNQVTVQVSGPSQCLIDRVPFNLNDRIIEHGCMDLAQRYGQLNQINKYICSYNYLTQRVGLIIENIVNQRINGQVSVMRSIKGLKCKVQILPINRDFYQQVPSRGPQEVYKLNEVIEFDIPKGKAYTVVLKLKGGMDRKFFKSFDFGC